MWTGRHFGFQLISCLRWLWRLSTVKRWAYQLLSQLACFVSILTKRGQRFWLFSLFLSTFWLLFANSPVYAQEPTPTPQTWQPLFSTPTPAGSKNYVCPGSQPVGWGTVTPDPTWLLFCAQCITPTPAQLQATPTQQNTPSVCGFGTPEATRPAVTGTPDPWQDFCGDCDYPDCESYYPTPDPLAPTAEPTPQVKHLYLSPARYGYWSHSYVDASGSFYWPSSTTFGVLDKANCGGDDLTAAYYTSWQVTTTDLAGDLAGSIGTYFGEIKFWGSGSWTRGVCWDKAYSYNLDGYPNGGWGRACEDLGLSVQTEFNNNNVNDGSVAAKYNWYQRSAGTVAYTQYRVCWGDEEGVYPADPTPTPDPNDFCSEVLPNVQSEDYFGQMLPVIQTGVPWCGLSLPTITMPLDWLSNVGQLINIDLPEGIYIPGIEICFVPIEFGTLYILGVAVDLDWMSFIVGLVAALRIFLRS
jgi:hypothetical protein